MYEAVNIDEPEQRQTETEYDVTEKQLREESSVVIRELQSVLAHVTSEKQREMWKQQLFPSYRSKKSVEKASNSFPSRKNETTDVSGPPSLCFSANSISLLPSSSSVTNKSCLSSETECAETQDSLPISDLDPKTRFEVQHSFEKSADTSSDNIHVSDQNVDAENSSFRKLKFYKRIAPPGRLPSKLRKQKPGSCAVDKYGNDAMDGGTKSDENVKAELSGDKSQPDWTCGLGIGFSTNLAMQAVALAKKRTNTLSPSHQDSLTYGTDSSDNN